MLLALFLNEVRTHIKEERFIDQVQEKIAIEISNNLNKVRVWETDHQNILDGLKDIPLSMTKDDLFKQDFLRDGIYKSTLTDATWQAYKITRAFTNTDFDIIKLLAELYNLQSIGVETTLKRIIKLFFSENDQIVKRLRMEFHELVAQESYLIQAYEKALIDLENIKK